ncbi:MAG: phenylalanine--tRNA ligase subunit beta [Alkalispirochaetaceae bacterium]
MPKIEIYQQSLFHYIGSKVEGDRFLNLLTAAKAELDEPTNAEGLMKIELNDTNRPDLWSTAGLGRQLRLHLGGAPRGYDFFSRAGSLQATEERTILVDPGLAEVRPYIAGFAVSGKGVDEATLKDLIQTQEKLCWNYGRKRKSIAMGLYRTDLIEYPVRYTAVDPDTTRFVPLQESREMSLRQIIEEHPKGKEFGWIVSGMERMPFLTDNQGEVLSFPPIINSARLGAVEVGDERLFIELTGTDIDSLLLTCSIVACDIADAGFTIHPVRVEYPYDTPYGRELVTPFYFQEAPSTTVGFVNSMLGMELDASQITGALARMGISATVEGETITVTAPEYRNDFLHPVDIVEDVMIGHGMDLFEPEAPKDFTVGRLSEVERLARQVKSLFVGLGYQEMIFNYLGSRKDFVEKMYPRQEWESRLAETVQIANPMSENYEFLRPSILPFLLAAESVSANAVYPHRVFEVGKVARVDESDVYGSRSIDLVGFLTAGAGEDFNSLYSHIAALLFYLQAGYRVEEGEDSRFIPGRVGRLVVAESGEPFGLFGELHPEVLEKWGIQVPCAAGEISIDFLLNPGLS